MERSLVFDRLVTELTPEKRRSLLEKLKKAQPISESPVVAPLEEEQDVDFEKEFQLLGFFERILIWIRAFVTHSVKELVLEDHLLKNLNREVQKKAPGLMDYKRKLLLPHFFESIEKLRTHLLALYPFVNLVGGKRRAPFIAFLAALEMETTTQRLHTELDPYYIIARSFYHLEPPFEHASLGQLDIPSPEQLSDAELRKRLETQLEDILQDASPEEKARMYMDLRFLDRIIKCVYFPWEKLLALSRPLPELPPSTCPFKRIEGEIRYLAETVFSLRDPIPSVLLEALVLYKEDLLLNEAESSEEQTRLAYPLSKIDEALQGVREFASKVPLLPLVKIVTGRINYHPPLPGGGEDWHNHFKHFWKGKLDESFRSFLVVRRKDELSKELLNFFPASSVQLPLESPIRGYPITLLGYYFLRSFWETKFSAYNRLLRILLIDGMFYREGNREEFNEAFRVLVSITEGIEKSGPLTGWDSLSLEQKHAWESKIQSWLEQIRESFHSIGKILDGILYGEAGGRYDTLSNLGSIGGRGNAQLVKGWGEIINETTSMTTIIDKLILLDKKGT